MDGYKMRNTAALLLFVSLSLLCVAKVPFFVAVNENTRSVKYSHSTRTLSFSKQFKNRLTPIRVNPRITI